MALATIVGRFGARCICRSGTHSLDEGGPGALQTRSPLVRRFPGNVCSLPLHPHDWLTRRRRIRQIQLCKNRVESFLRGFRRLFVSGRQPQNGCQGHASPQTRRVLPTRDEQLRFALRMSADLHTWMSRRVDGEYLRTGVNANFKTPAHGLEKRAKQAMRHSSKWLGVDHTMVLTTFLMSFLHTFQVLLCPWSTSPHNSAEDFQSISTLFRVRRLWSDASTAVQYRCTASATQHRLTMHRTVQRNVS